jgi:hypothetical protein
VLGSRIVILRHDPLRFQEGLSPISAQLTVLV